MHRRCNHLHEAGHLKLGYFEVTGISGISTKLSPVCLCPDCATAKSTVADINPISLTRFPLLPYLDIWGPTSTPELSGNRYVIYTTSAIVGVLSPQAQVISPNAWTSILISISSFGHKPHRTWIASGNNLIKSFFKSIADHLLTPLANGPHRTTRAYPCRRWQAPLRCPHSRSLPGSRLPFP